MPQLMYVGWIGAIPMAVSYGLAVLCGILFPMLQETPRILSMGVAFYRDLPDLADVGAGGEFGLGAADDVDSLEYLFKWW